MSDTLTVAVFRPDDERLEEAIAYLESRGVDVIPDPMLSIRATGESPRTDGEYTVFTSKTGVELAADAGWSPGESKLVAIGPKTATAAERAGFEVDLVPEAYTSSGLVEALAPAVDGTTVEVARSDHGSAVLLEGLQAAGAYIHETVLYELVIPEGAGRSVSLAAEGCLDVALFTSSLTVEHFVQVAEERGVAEAAMNGLAVAVVGVIGPPTAETADELGIRVDVVPSEAEFEVLARETLEYAGIVE
jgi:uroporphyrinogen-III synthase